MRGRWGKPITCHGCNGEAGNHQSTKTCPGRCQANGCKVASLLLLLRLHVGCGNTLRLRTCLFDLGLTSSKLEASVKNDASGSAITTVKIVWCEQRLKQPLVPRSGRKAAHSRNVFRPLLSLPYAECITLRCYCRSVVTSTHPRHCGSRCADCGESYDLGV